MIGPDLESRLDEVLGADGRAWVGAAAGRVVREGGGALAELLPALARRTGRGPLGGGVREAGGCRVDLDRWRACDAAGFVLLARAEPEGATIVDLFRHGDLEERRILMRCLALLPVGPASVDLLGEAQRTNVQVHFEASVCDSNLVARAVGHGGFTAGDAYRIVLKAAFLDLPLGRLFDILDHASPELTRMVTGLATEREAAGRPVWADTNRVIARAPIEGTGERVAAGLEDPDERQRLASAEALLDLADPALHARAAARLGREPSPAVRAALERALAGAKP